MHLGELVIRTRDRRVFVTFFLGGCRRFTALHVSSSLLAGNKSQADVDVDEVAGHVYLFLKEQLELATPPLSYGLLHGTIIGNDSS